LDGTQKDDHLGSEIFAKTVIFSGVVGGEKLRLLQVFLRGVAEICGENAW
jgi:hypothetical protein